MHEFSTRAWKLRRHASAIRRSLLAAVLVLASALPISAEATLPQNSPAEADPSVITPAYDAAILLVANGQEGFQLSARLSEDSEPLQQPIAWKIFDENGLMLFEVTSPAATVDLPPGSYKLQAAYGSALYQRTIALEQGQRQDLSLLLDAGAIRILAHVRGLLTDRPASNLIYANSGPGKGRLVTISKVPGEIVPLAAGTYRVESRFEPGNAILVTDVTVRPGIMSSVDVSHNAGLMRFRYDGPQSDDVHWQVLNSSGQLLLQLQGGTTSAMLKPGDYRVEMQAAGHMAASRFLLSAGEEKSLQLGR